MRCLYGFFCYGRSLHFAVHRMPCGATVREFFVIVMVAHELYKRSASVLRPDTTGPNAILSHAVTCDGHEYLRRFQYPALFPMEMVKCEKQCQPIVAVKQRIRLDIRTA
jgi:hypothetical protein